MKKSNETPAAAPLATVAEILESKEKAVEAEEKVAPVAAVLVDEKSSVPVTPPPVTKTLPPTVLTTDHDRLSAPEATYAPETMMFFVTPMKESPGCRIIIAEIGRKGGMGKWPWRPFDIIKNLNEDIMTASLDSFSGRNTSVPLRPGPYVALVALMPPKGQTGSDHNWTKIPFELSPQQVAILQPEPPRKNASPVNPATQPAPTTTPPADKYDQTAGKVEDLAEKLTTLGNVVLGPQGLKAEVEKQGKEIKQIGERQDVLGRNVESLVQGQPAMEQRLLDAIAARQTSPATAATAPVVPPPVTPPPTPTSTTPPSPQEGKGRWMLIVGLMVVAIVALGLMSVAIMGIVKVTPQKVEVITDHNRDAVMLAEMQAIRQAQERHELESRRTTIMALPFVPVYPPTVEKPKEEKTSPPAPTHQCRPVEKSENAPVLEKPTAPAPQCKPVEGPIASAPTPALLGPTVGPTHTWDKPALVAQEQLPPPQVDQRRTTVVIEVPAGLYNNQYYYNTDVHHH